MAPAVRERYADIFVGTSEMAQLMRAHDWAATPLGPPEHWPEGLKVALRILLTSRFEMWLGWGPDICFFYNDAYRPTLGRKHPQGLGQPCHVLWAEIWDDIKDRMQTVYRDGQSTWDRALLLILERSGYREETYHTFSYSPLLGDTGQVEGLFCAVSEETERVLSERRMAVLSRLSAGLAASGTRASALQAIEHGLAGAAHDLPFAMVYLFDAQGRAQLACSVGIAASHGLADAGHWGAERILSGLAEAHVALDPSADAPTGPWAMAPQTAMVRAVGGRGGVRPSGFLVAALNPHRPGDVLAQDFVRLLAGPIGASLDNADAYEAERQHAESLAEAVQTRTAERDRLHMLFRQAPGFMCVLRGPTHVYELYNESYQQLVGHRVLAGQSIEQALPELAGQGFLELLDKVRRSGAPFVGRGVRVMLERRPGAALEERFVNFVYQPIFDGSGHVDGIFAEGNDVTEQVRAERALKELNGHLEMRIAERTEELASTLDRLRAESAERAAAEEALRHAQKMEAVGQLTGGIAHDFNNFLQGITGALDLIQRRIAQGRIDEVGRFLGDAGSSARRAAALTHRLLAFSRRQPLAPRGLDVNALVLSMEGLIHRSMDERLQLRLDLAPDLWPTLCDPNQLESAVLNLCINARDAMPDGGVLTVATRNLAADGVHDGDYVQICVQDNGLGMAPDVLERAFEPFFTTKPLGQGTGLGLSMIYGFARQSEGYASIDSTPGQGTRVQLCLPRHLGPVGPAPAAPAPALAPGGGHTVLVVEDEEVVRRMVVELLQELGYRTLQAADGPAGLALLTGPETIDLLVTDIGLPGLNGRQVADAARLHRPGLKVLLMTGYAESATRADGVLDSGMELLTKPFAVDDLLAQVQRMLPAG
ncbi:ATP-binding protein [Pseudorhodoferax sp. Leaf267]|uniref:ATP-binding protein n=1 Tax=Pseudorhodoferax sp. Leaf267 TaxID=1736316 RepID=UPI0006F46D8C|nr:ATP-binding protein [Pseudorhodoferax sp. Leaf267]KQP18048.1 histidine kinase [Pseudorhodoferax sp. Leaf267]